MALHKDVKDKVIKDFGTSANDTGSSAVQVALLTESIRLLTGHCQKFPKDFSTKHGLLKKVCQRRGLLTYLERKDSAAYRQVIGRLGLKK
ncbi:MAG: 30S ribosomal protein S15 [Candidatus Dependentiae bacterium]|nr:30S ribosomal protein S15 [Candidatus Dependentiae bacterium]